MEITNKDIGGTHTKPFDFTKTAWVQPFRSHETLSFEARFDPGEDLRGAIGFNIDLNADLSINLSWTAQEIDDEVEGSISGAMVVPRDATRGWTGLRVNNDDPIDADWTEMGWTVVNGQAPA